MSDGPHVFVSWSGERASTVAVLVAALIRNCLQHIRPWVSDEDIDRGDMWSPALRKALDSCEAGIVIATKESVQSDWVLFEAGAISKRVEREDQVRLHVLLLDMNNGDLPKPLRQYQTSQLRAPPGSDGRNGQEEMLRLLHSLLVQFKPPQPRSEADFERVFRALWPEFERGLEAVPVKAPAPPKPPTADEAVPEILASLGRLSRRMDRMEARNQRVHVHDVRARNQRRHADDVRGITLGELAAKLGPMRWDPRARPGDRDALAEKLDEAVGNEVAQKFAEFVGATGESSQHDDNDNED